jgi:hypothetical protein
MRAEAIGTRARARPPVRPEEIAMSPEATELTLYIDNDQRLYKQKTAIFRALARKKDRGRYDERLAPKAFAALTNLGAKKYVREFGGPGDRWNLVFSPVDRRQAAVHFVEDFLGWYAADYQALKNR